MTASAYSVRHVDLATSEDAPDQADAPVLSIFWWGGLPLGMRADLPEELPYGKAQRRQLTAELAAKQLAARSGALGAPLRATYEGRPQAGLTLSAALEARNLVEALSELAVPVGGSAAALSVVICTKDRCQALARCLASLAGQRATPGEVIVVDNSRDGTAQEACRAHPSVRYLHAPQGGLSAARNAGLQACRGEIVAFTDDDVELHPDWAAEAARAFETHSVEALTGLVLPARLDTPAQRAFQFDMGGFGTTFVPLLFDRRFFEETRPSGAHVWKIGAGANMAFRRSVFERLGPFDERLGAGAAGCSEDSEFWYRLLLRGGSCLYEPRAVVFHHHRPDWKGFKRQMRAYMKGHVAALVVQYDNSGDRGNLKRIRRQLPGYFVKTFLQALSEGRADRLSILAAEVSGWLAGLPYLLRFAWRRRRVRPPQGREASRRLADGGA